MSMSAPVSYFRSVMNNLGFKEWPDAFADDNIPATLIDRQYHLQLSDAANLKQNQDIIDFSCPIAVKFFIKGFRTTAEGRDKATAYFDNVLKASLLASTRCTQTNGIKNVIFDGGNIATIGDNDNLVKVTMNFNCILMLATA